MNFNLEDKVVHPRRPEWGIGVVRNLQPPDKVSVLFSQAGLKILNEKFIQLQNAPEQTKPVYDSILTKLTLQKKEPPTAPQFFAREYSHRFVESWQQKFLHGNLGDTWQEQYPQLFSTDDLVHSRSIYGKNPNTFATWLGAILLQRQTGYKSIFGNYLQAKSHEKHKPLRDTLSITRFLQLQPLIKKIGAAGAPTLFLCEHPEYSDIKTDTESVFSNEQAGVFIYVRYGHEHFSSEQVQWIKALHQEGYSLWAIHLQKM